jgi:hypothetical protein
MEGIMKKLTGKLFAYALRKSDGALDVSEVGRLFYSSQSPEKRRADLFTIVGTADITVSLLDDLAINCERIRVIRARQDAIISECNAKIAKLETEINKLLGQEQS